MRLYIKQIPTQERIVLAGDHTAWARPDAVTLQDRTTEHYCTAIPNNRPIAPAEGYSTIAWIPETEGSWAIPLRHERITSWESPISKAVWQLKQVCKYLPVRPISLWDSEYRFLKQRLHWTVPKLSTPKQCVSVACPKGIRWSDLMPLISWELWLARDIVVDNPLPWQKSITKLTPGRVAQAMGGILAAIGTPAQSPKPRGKSPGWSPGQPRQRRIRYPLVKKGTTRRKSQVSKTA